MGKIQKIAFLASLLLHSALLVFLIWQPQNEREQIQETPFFVTFKEPKSQIKKTPKKKGKSSKKKSSKGGKGKSSNRDFYSKFSPLGDLAGSYSDHKERSENQWSGDAVMETMSGMGLPEYSENYYFFEVMAAHLNQNIPYPKELWEHQIQGKVWFKILVNKKGELIQVIDSSKKNPVLAAYIMINIYRSLKSPFPKRYWYTKEKDLAFYLLFDYKTAPESDHNIPEEQSVKYFKNRIEFKRVAKAPDFLARKLAENIRYVPPIVPTPLGPVVDFRRLYLMVNAWMEEDPKVKKANRKVMTKEKMEALLNQSKKDFRK